MTDPREMIEDIRSADGVSGGITLDDWEEGFVDSIENRLNDDRSLTPGQLASLEKIWDRI